MQAVDLYKHIAVTPGVVGGKPHIVGHRISVRDVVVWHEHMGQSADEISSDYNFDLAEVYAALAYYFDNRKEIDNSIAAADAFDAELSSQSKVNIPSRSADLHSD
jgi:uncharacterized protein (DUF433 family)